MATLISVRYLGDLQCAATHRESGETLVTEASVESGGIGRNFSPTDLVATAVATCVATILGIMAERHAVDLSGMSIEVTRAATSKGDRRIGSLRTRVAIPATALADPRLRQRFEAAARTCPVHRSLDPRIDAPIEFHYHGSASETTILS